MITEDPLESLAIQWILETGPENIERQTLNVEERRKSVEGVVHGVRKPEHPSLVQNNRAFHRYLMDGVKVESNTLTPALSEGEREEDRRVVDHALLIDFENPTRNDFLVVNQFAFLGLRAACCRFP